MKRTYAYRTKGTCSSEIKFDMDNGILTNVKFTGGCNGNLQGISRMVEGSDAREVVKRLHGIKCGMKQTSCPDQLAEAISAALEREKQEDEQPAEKV